MTKGVDPDLDLDLDPPDPELPPELEPEPEPPPGVAPAPERTAYYLATPSGHLKATLWLSDEEAALRGDLLTEPPPEPPPVAPPSLDEIRELRWEYLKSARTVKEFEPFVFLGEVFDGDRESQRRLTGAISAAKSAIASGNEWTQEWVLHDNSTMVLSSADFVAIEQVLITRTSQIFQISTALRHVLNLAATVEAIEAIEWP